MGALRGGCQEAIHGIRGFPVQDLYHTLKIMVNTLRKKTYASRTGPGTAWADINGRCAATRLVSAQRPCLIAAAGNAVSGSRAEVFGKAVFRDARVAASALVPVFAGTGSRKTFEDF